MVYICGVLFNGVLYRIDNKVYFNRTSALKRCEKLNKEAGKLEWQVFQNNSWKPLEEE